MNNEVSTFTLKTPDTVRPTKIRKIETDVEDDEDKDEEVADNSTGIVNFFTNRATEVFSGSRHFRPTRSQEGLQRSLEETIKNHQQQIKKYYRNTTTFSKDVQE